jgi:2-octaprenyl-6-methoxyphenol hydroxylase
LDADVLIAGGGPVGLLLALAVEHSPLRVLQIGKGSPPPDRPIALSHGSRLLLERTGIFPALRSTAIMSIHVSQRNGFGRTVIRARDYDLPALGCVVSYRELAATLQQRLAAAPLQGSVLSWQRERDGVAVRWRRGANAAARPEPLRARLLVVADGLPEHRDTPSAPRSDEGRRDYGQSAVVARVHTELPHGHRAWERFTPHGPLALLPDGSAFALIWSTATETARDLCNASDEIFLQRLSEAFGTRLGRFVKTGPRTSFPLALRYTPVAPGPGVVAIGNAAQTLHPVAGQGLNLGLRDAWELSQLLAGSTPGELASAAFGQQFARRRRLDRHGGIQLTDALVRLFSGSDPFLTAARGAGLTLLDVLPPARRFLAHRMMYGARALP